MLTKSEINTVTELIYKYMQPTAQIEWPLLSKRAGCSVIVKHENHTPIGAFKIRGGLLYISRLIKENQSIKGVIAATRGNHGQSIGFAAKTFGIKAKIVVPLNNNPEKNAAMKALGVELIEHGSDFQQSFEYASKIASAEGLIMIPSFHKTLVEGVSTYALELFNKYSDLDRIYVPIGLGSGICGVISIRDMLQLKTEVIGVVSENANSYALSFQAKRPVSTSSAETIADGIACRTPHPEAFEYILKGAERIVSVSEKDIIESIKFYFSDTHNIAEGSAAAALAAMLKENNINHNKKIGLILSGGNVDINTYKKALES